MLEPAPTLGPEELARANFYGLLARLFSAPPDRSLLEALADAGDLEAEEGALAAAWRELAQTAARADPEVVREEYDTAFVGTGKAPVTLYTSAYSMRYTNETPLASLRAELAVMGLARKHEATEPEDHIAALCEVMRHLIAEEQAELAAQRRFFSRWIWPVAEPLCAAIMQSSVTSFYRAVAGFAKSFFALENSAFEML